MKRFDREIIYLIGESVTFYKYDLFDCSYCPFNNRICRYNSFSFKRSFLGNCDTDSGYVNNIYAKV